MCIEFSWKYYCYAGKNIFPISLVDVRPLLPGNFTGGVHITIKKASEKREKKNLMVEFRNLIAVSSYDSVPPYFHGWGH
uniref:Uncharacterized protein n=1 Tax=Nelumbo nucifera TaxID=4432 RepID=A0A822XY45_NELNU|nr:TPA_asm: hypothetical protein HUJ06_025594 [Nelumbo nucifera]